MLRKSLMLVAVLVFSFVAMLGCDPQSPAQIELDKIQAGLDDLDLDLDQIIALIESSAPVQGAAVLDDIPLPENMPTLNDLIALLEARFLKLQERFAGLGNLEGADELDLPSLEEIEAKIEELKAKFAELEEIELPAEVPAA